MGIYNIEKSKKEQIILRLSCQLFKKIERHPLQPFLPKEARLLMLGSFPPPKERWCMDFFYPNPQNDMWRIMGQVFFGDKEHFVERGECHDICCTGGKAAETLADMLHTNTPKVGEYIETVFADRPIRFWRMPSTSRAYPMSLDKKAGTYHHMFAKLEKI